MSLKKISSRKGLVDAIEYEPKVVAHGVAAFGLLLPGTSIRPGPGADKADKYHFDLDVPSIYRTIGQRLSDGYGVPCLQLCWRRFPADGGLTHDAVNDMMAGIAFMKERYGAQCGAIFVGYSFGGAAILQFLAQAGENPLAILNPIIGDSRKPRPTPWLHGCVALSGALKGQNGDDVSLLSALKQLEQAQVPLLVVHGSDDDNVALSAAHKLYRKAASPKSICVLQGGDHNLREPIWQELVAEIISNWLVRISGTRGCSGASRSRSVQQAHHSAAASLCQLSVQRASVVTCAFEPSPQRLDSGGLLPFTACEVPNLQEVFAVKAGAPPTELSCCRLAKIAELTALHASRHNKARERLLKERRGPTKEAYLKLQASRAERRSLDLPCIDISGPEAAESVAPSAVVSPSTGTEDGP